MDFYHGPTVLSAQFLTKRRRNLPIALRFFCKKIIPLRNCFSLSAKIRENHKKVGKKGFHLLHFTKIGGMMNALKK